GLGLVGPAEAVERLVEPVAARVPREHPARAIAAVRGGREPDDEHPGAWIAEAGHRAAPVGLVAERPTPLARDLLAVGSQRRAALANQDCPRHGGEATEGRVLRRAFAGH